MALESCQGVGRGEVPPRRAGGREFKYELKDKLKDELGYEFKDELMDKLKDELMDKLKPARRKPQFSSHR